MPVRDLREWAEKVGQMGELKVLTGIHWDMEIGCLTELNSQSGEAPALIFDEITGYAKGFRVMSNSLGSLRRVALALNIPAQESQRGMVKAWKERSRELTLIPPRMVSDGPIMENVFEGQEIDMFKFPVPKWHPRDGGRYIGTGSVTITQDPDEGWVNLGTYRVMVINRDTLGFYVSPGKHGRIHREKYLVRGEPCRVAISFGHDPLLFLAGCLEIPYGISEYDYVGGVRGEPVEVIKGELSGLPLPAYSEIAIEGEVLFDQPEQEGPFGEFTGYYASGARAEPVIKVKRLMHRNDPIILGSRCGKPPGETGYWFSVLKSALVWEELEKAGVPDVRGVWCHPSAATRFLVIVSIKQRYAGHARQAGLVAAGCHAAAYCGRYVLVVDEDIDPTNTDDVIWAMTTRSDPQSSIEIVRRCWSTPLDPLVRKGQPALNSRAIIDACRPYEWIDEFPPVNAFSEEDIGEARKRWGNLLVD